MANEDVLGPRKTMFVLVIVVGCFAVLWPRILSPLILGSSREQLKPNDFDREAGCCEVMFASEIALLEILNEICNTSVQSNGKMTPYEAAECRRTVNETCGVDIADFLKRNDNVGKTSKKLIDTMKSSNSSCMKEHFGVPSWSLSSHTAVNNWLQTDTLKQERSPIRGMGPHPALRERGRAITTTPPAPKPAPLPAHMRVRSSPLSVYYELDIKPPPIPGMRPPLGNPGGPVPAPKSSMGFVMPIYTICIIVFFVYTLSKILFKRVGTVPYDEVSPDPQFRRRVFRDDSRSSPEKLGDIELEALRERLAETERAMQRIVGQLAARNADPQENHTRPYTNGTVIHSGPVQIVASEYNEPTKEKSPDVVKEASPEPKEETPEPKEPTPEAKEPTPEPKEATPEPKEVTPEEDEEEEEEIVEIEEEDESPVVKDTKKQSDDFIKEEKESLRIQKQSTPELLEEALQEERDDQDNASVKVVGMEVTAHAADGSAWPRPGAPPVTPLPPARPLHEAEDVKSIFLETEIPQQSRVLVTDFEDNRNDKKPTKHTPSVVSGKMTLSLIQDAPRETPERDPESTVDDFTTASALTQPADEKEEELSDEEIEEEIEVEEIEEEVEEIEEEEEEEENEKTEKK